MVTPLYRQVYDELKRRTVGGEYGPGSRIPSETKLRDEFGVSVITVRRALHELALDGIVEPRHGIGTFVSEPDGDAVVVGMSNFTSSVASGRLRLVRTLILDEMTVCPKDVAAKIGLQPYSMVRHLGRLDIEGGYPISIDDAYIPPDLASGITTEIAASPLFMHLWQQECGIELTRTQYDIAVHNAELRDTELLQIDGHVPILRTAETVYDAKSRPCGLLVTRYRGDRCKLSGSVSLVRRRTSRGVIGE